MKTTARASKNSLTIPCPSLCTLRRFGLSNKSWFREVWVWQTQIHASTPAAALSLSKRESIVDSRIVSLSYNNNNKTGHREELLAFLKRLIPGTKASLKSLDLKLGGDDIPAADLSLLKETSSGLVSLSIQHVWPSRRQQPELTATLPAILEGCQFKESLKYLDLDVGEVSEPCLAVIASSFPNLEDIRVSKVHFAVDERSSIGMLKFSVQVRGFRTSNPSVIQERGATSLNASRSSGTS
jgi:hypothetical protein